jgi:hypothetical protein
MFRGEGAPLINIQRESSCQTKGKQGWGEEAKGRLREVLGKNLYIYP